MEQDFTRTTCPYCGVGCGVLAKREIDGSVTIKGDLDHPANFGKLCSKGLALGETFGLEQRLTKPRIEGVDVEWDEATRHVAQTFGNAIRDHGPDSVAFYVSGQFLTEDYYVANKLMKGFIGSANIDTNSRLCMASAVAGHKRAFGADVVPCNYTDLEEADLVVLVGSNLAWCHPVLFQRLLAAREKRGSKLVVIDPRRTATAECADLHLQIKSGSDVSLFNGLLLHLYSNSEIDAQFVFAHTEGLATTMRVANQHDDVRVAADTGVPEDQLRAFYKLFAAHAKTVTGFSMGVNQAEDGTNKVNAIINCHLLTGRIGKDGAGPFSITGQPNAMGGREVGGLANMLAAHMDIENADHRFAVQDFWQSPRIAEKPGLKAVELFQAMRTGKIKAVWIMATNPAVSMPNSSQIAEALKACPFVVVSDVTANTETAQYADVLLPAMGWGEKDGTVTNSERRVSRQRQFVPATREAKPDWRIMCEVAQAMGFDGFRYQNSAEIFAEHAALTQILNNGNRALDLSAIASLNYDKMSSQQWGGERPFANGTFETDNGKARFIPTQDRERTRPDGLNFTLNTGRIRDQWHTMTRTGLVPRLFGHRAEPYVEITPEDAQRIDIAPAGLVEIGNARGKNYARVFVTDTVQTGQIFQPMHWSSKFAKQALVNSALSDIRDPVSGQPALKSAKVSVTPYRAKFYGFGIGINQVSHETEYFATYPVTTGHAFECADTRLPMDWVEFVSTLNPGVSIDSSVHGSHPAHFRCLSLKDGVLDFAFFASDSPVAASRDWLQRHLGQRINPLEILAGRSMQAVEDRGSILCACMTIGRNQISRFISQNYAVTLNDVCVATTAGTGCGSCRIEIQKMIREAQPLVHAAE